jgi:WD40 repeat protein
MFSIDGQLLLTTGSQKGALKIWNVEDGQLQHVLKDPSELFESFAPTQVDLGGGNSGIATFSRNGRNVLSVHNDDNMRLWDTQNGSMLHTLHNKDTILCCFAPDSQKIVSCAKDQSTLVVWCVATGHNLRVLDADSGAIRSVCFAPCSTKLLACSRNIDYWDCETGGRHTANMHRMAGITSATGCCVSGDGQMCMTWREPNSLELLDGFSCVLWNPTRLADPLDNGITHVSTLVGHCGHINHGHFSPQGDTVLTASLDSTMKLWSLGPSCSIFRTGIPPLPGGLLRTFRIQGDNHPTHKDFDLQIRRCGFSPLAEIVVSLDSNDSLKIWGASDSSLKASLASVADFSFQPSGKAIAIVKTDGKLEVWGYQ